MRRVAVLALALLATGHAAGTNPQKALEKAAKLADSGRYDDAERFLKDLVARAPGEVSYRVALDALRKNRVVDRIQGGARALARGLTAKAKNSFAQPYALDPQNEYARQRFSDARAGLRAPKVEVLEAAEEPE